MLFEAVHGITVNDSNDTQAANFSNGLPTSFTDHLTTLATLNPIVNSTNIGQTPHQRPVSVWLILVLSPLFFLVGNVGNLLSIAVLRRGSLRDSPISVFLITLAVFDTILIDAGLPEIWCDYAFKIDTTALSSFSCKFQTFLQYLSKYMSAWILVAVTVQRLIIVWSPLKSKSWCSLKISRIATCVIFLILLCYNFHIFFTMELRPKYLNKTMDGNPIFECVANGRDSNDFLMTVWPWIEFAVAHLAPYSILGISNAAVIYKLCRQHRLRTRRLSEHACKVATSSGRLGRTTLLLLTVSFVFIACSTPYLVYILGEDTLKTDAHPERVARYEFLGDVSYLAIYMNSSINFLLYCLAGSNFRQELVSMFSRQKKNTPSQNGNIFTSDPSLSVHL